MSTSLHYAYIIRHEANDGKRQGLLCCVAQTSRQITMLPLGKISYRQNKWFVNTGCDVSFLVMLLTPTKLMTRAFMTQCIHFQ